MASTELKSTITLKGSAKMICEYLNYGINSILYQRGIYPPETFKADEKYGISLLMSTDNKIIEFVNTVLTQLEEWISSKAANKVSLIIQNVETKQNIERWDFEIDVDKITSAKGDSDKPLKTIQNEIRDVFKQIISTIAILPLIDCLCAFDILIYTQDVEIPQKWNEDAVPEITNSQTLQLRSFDTGMHKVNTLVTYKVDS